MADSSETSVAKKSIGAVVSTSHTGDFDARLSHLTQGTGFIETMHPASFRDALDLHVGEVLLHGEVAFVCDSPMGWLIRFDVTPEFELLFAQFMNSATMEEQPPPPAVAASVAAVQEEEEEEDENELWGEPTPTFQGPPLLRPQDALADLLAGLDEPTPSR